MDDDKPKSGYRQNRELTIICGLWGVLIFFRLDELIGAVGLQQYYTVGSAIAIAFIIAGGVTLIYVWRSPPMTFTRLLSIYLVISVICILVTIVIYPMYIIAGWFSAMFVFWLSSRFLLVGLFTSFLILVWFTRQAVLLNPNLVKSATLFMLIFSIPALLYFGADTRNAEATTFGSVSFADHHYFVRVHWGWLGDPDQLILYECNQYALFCEIVYASNPSRFYNSDIVLVPNVTGSIDILVDNVLLYRYAPS